jgi:hypothetical protein
VSDWQRQPGNGPPPGLPPGSPWGNPAAGNPAWSNPADARIPHAYPLAVRDPSLSVAIGLVLRTLPYAVTRFLVLLAVSIALIVWLVVMIGGAAWLGAHVATAFGWVWAIGCLALAGFVWSTLLRYALHLIECGHVAVLTELITRGSLPDPAEGQFAYGKRVVLARIGQETLLYGLNALVRGIVQSLHNTLDWLAQILPIPGLEGVSRLVDIVLRGATRYLDKAIFSYNLARGDEDVWRSSREGLVYYAQNVRPILKTTIWSVLLERVLTVLLFLVLLAPAAAVTLALPASVREIGGLMTVLVAILLAGPLRAAFVKPLFMTMMIVRFHSAIEGQAINPEWDARLASISGQFRDMGAEAAAALGQSRLARLWS